jgi:hypothetical protein
MSAPSSLFFPVDAKGGSKKEKARERERERENKKEWTRISLRR